MHEPLVVRRDSRIRLFAFHLIAQLIFHRPFRFDSRVLSSWFLRNMPMISISQITDCRPREETS
jgi:hypothetical protein